MKTYKNIIEKSTKDNISLKRIKIFCDIFKLFYEEKKEIDKEEIKIFIRNTKKALEETDILDEKLFKHFFEKLNEINIFR